MAEEILFMFSTVLKTDDLSKNSIRHFPKGKKFRIKFIFTKTNFPVK